MTFNSPFKDGRGGISEGGFADRIRVYSDYAFKSEYQTDVCFFYGFCVCYACECERGGLCSQIILSFFFK